ncbi:MAG TPA: hypothetical protein VHR72_14785 [Gemmataceae bacterium]|nr:hypothetical protein [Gemmataceae bacterium]
MQSVTKIHRWVLAAFVASGVAMSTMAQPPGRGEFVTVRGRVESITTAKKGEADGAMLTDRTWIHWPPHMGERFLNVVRRGDRVLAAGVWETGPKGDKKLEVSTVTNIETDRTVDNPDRPASEANRAASSQNGDLEARIRSLEAKIDRLIGMVEKMQRDKK